MEEDETPPKSETDSLDEASLNDETLQRILKVRSLCRMYLDKSLWEQSFNIIIFFYPFPISNLTHCIGAVGKNHSSGSLNLIGKGCVLISNGDRR